MHAPRLTGMRVHTSACKVTDQVATNELCRGITPDVALLAARRSRAFAAANLPIIQ